jgi:hypothetical protein
MERLFQRSDLDLRQPDVRASPVLSASSRRNAWSLDHQHFPFGACRMIPDTLRRVRDRIPCAARSGRRHARAVRDSANKFRRGLKLRNIP